MKAIEAAFPELLGDDFTALRAGPTASMFVDEGRVRVKGIDAPRRLYDTKALGLHVLIGGARLRIAGFKNLASEDAPYWEAWTVADVEAERVRRWPEITKAV